MPSTPPHLSARPPLSPRRRRGHAGRPAATALLALGLVVGLGLGVAACGDKAKDDLGEALTGKDKIAAGGAAALEAELSIVAKEVASWYTSGDGDPQVQVSGGSYYICAAGATDCAAQGVVISGASQGVEVHMGRLGAATWCVQGSSGSDQAHVTAESGTAESGPC